MIFEALMFSSPAQNRSQFSRPAAKYVVLLGDEDGSLPSVADETEHLTLVEFDRQAGGGRVDAAKFIYDLAKAEARLVDTTVPVGHNRQIEIRKLDEDDEPNEIVFWGVIAGQGQRIDKSSEEVTVEARVDKHLFGAPLTSIPFWNVEETEIETCELPLVFNPEIDEIIEGNRSDRSAVIEEGDYHPFLDPESMRTAGAEEYQDAERSEWNVIEAVLMLCWHLNPDEEYIKNPTRDELLADFDAIADFSALQNVSLAYGKYLPELLDDLLRPWGYTWQIVHKLHPAGTRVTSLAFFRRGHGPFVSLKLQRPGETIDARETNVASLNANYSIVELANKIVVLGEFVKREFTAELVKGWPTADDTDDTASLARGETLANEKPFVCRKYVLNEAGDYNGTRAEITEHFALVDILEPPTVVRRRKFLPCLSRHTGDEEAESQGIYVEYWHPDNEGAGVESDPPADDPGWKKVSWPFSVLQKECGILFEGDTPPEELLHEEARVRVTATVMGDRRVRGEATRRESSPNGRDLTLVLEVKDKFHDRAVDSLSIFDGDDNPDTRNDWDEAEDYAEKLRDVEDCATVAVQVTLDGADHPEFELGKLIEKVEGRELSLDANDPDQGEPRRLQIVGMSWRLYGEQHLSLMLETYEPTLADERRGLIA
jgi:hypothetical protein